MIGRRELLTLIGGSAAAWPIVARAQQQPKLPTIGYFGISSASAGGPWTRAFVQRLRELGWVEDRTITIEFRWAEGRSESQTEAAAEFVRRNVDVIVTFGGAVPTFRQATSVIPIVFTIDADPVGRGLVASLGRPGGNVTGLSLQSTELAGKQLELLREMLPAFRRLAILANVDFRGALQEIGEVRAAAGILKVEIVDTLEIRRPDEIAPAFAALKGEPQALYVCGDALTNATRADISALAMGARLPTIYPTRIFLEAGGFISYGVDYADLHGRAGAYVDRILRGAKPADLPVEQPTKFELVINLKTAKALGLEVPPMLLARADEVIE
jgi:putative ABC transport system substrate-binding protein